MTGNGRNRNALTTVKTLVAPPMLIANVITATAAKTGARLKVRRAYPTS